MKMPDAKVNLGTVEYEVFTSYHIRLTDDMRMFIPDEVRNHSNARRCEKQFLRGSRPDAAIATSFVQSLNFGLGNLGASSICAAKNKGATPPAWLRDLAPILYSEGYTCTAAIYLFFFNFGK